MEQSAFTYCPGPPPPSPPPPSPPPPSPPPPSPPPPRPPPPSPPPSMICAEFQDHPSLVVSTLQKIIISVSCFSTQQCTTLCTDMCRSITMRKACLCSSSCSLGPPPPSPPPPSPPPPSPPPPSPPPSEFAQHFSLHSICFV